VNLDPDADPDALWAEPEARRGLLPAAAAKWAEAQGEDVLRAVQLAFFEARHVERRKIGRPEVVEEVLNEAGVDGAGVTKELLSDRRWLDAARADHEEAVGLGIFGVPTLVFDGAGPVFVRLTEVPEGERAAEVFRRVRDGIKDRVQAELVNGGG
jgi:predicted DsbA family dithiol-disulfide isomerase